LRPTGGLCVIDGRQMVLWKWNEGETQILPLPFFNEVSAEAA
jgi:hypothetical protein